MVQVIAYVALGANLGDAAQILHTVLAQLNTLPTTQLLTQSSFYKSPPFGEKADGPDYVNAVACLSTSLSPHALLDELQKLEQLHGRERQYQNAPRTLDLDVLLHGDKILSDERLTIPHPRMTERAFVLLPLSEISADLHWHDGQKIQWLSQLLPDVLDQRITKMNA